MPGTTAATAVEQLQHQRKGAIAISLTDFNAITVSQIAEGSGIEIAGAWIDFLVAESMGSNWAAMSAGVVYARIDSIALTSAYTATAPTWNEELQGWYDVTGQYRYYAKLYKDGSANYTQKALYTYSRSIMQLNEGAALNTGANADQILRMADDARILWDESEGCFDFDRDMKISAGNLNIVSGNVNCAVGYGINGVKKLLGILEGGMTQNDVFDALSPYIPNVGDKILVNGEISGNIVRYAERTASNIVAIKYNNSLQSYIDGNATGVTLYIAW